MQPPTALKIRLLRGLVGLVLVVSTLAGSSAVQPHSASASTDRPFAASSFWNTPLPAYTPTDPKSSTYADNIQRQIKAFYGNATINTTQYTAPVYTVGSSQAPVTFKFNNCQGKTWVDPQFIAQISNIPVPDDATPSAGTDQEMVVWQPSTDTLWETWGTQHRADGWYACWGGRITNASQSNGVFQKNYGVAATGLSLLGGMMRTSELQAGEINHVIDMSLVETRQGTYSYPANRTDGYTNSVDAIPEGQRFRLDPAVNVDALNLTPTAKAMAKAMQKYGLVIRDKSGAVTFYAENPTPSMNAGGANPYPGIFGTPSYSVLNNFPWNKLQALPFDYGKDGSTPGSAVPINNAATPDANGYRTVSTSGKVHSFGAVADKGSASTSGVVGIDSTSTTNGYWITTADGKVIPYGDAANLGNMAGKKLNAPVVGLAARADSSGYYLLGKDGGVFSFGNAPFFGSTGSIKLNQPVVGMSTPVAGSGYWFVASDGGVFSYGPDARFYGSTGAMKLNQPIVGMTATPSGNGYWLVASDGGIFAFGDARFYGSTGSIKLNKPIVGMTATPSGNGYWLVASDGGIFAFGDAQFAGSAASDNQPVVGLS